ALPISTLSFATMTLSASGSQGVGESAQGYGGDIDLLGSGGMLSADSLSVTAVGSTFGGLVSLAANLGLSDQAGSLQFGSLNAVANGGDSGGRISLTADSGSTLDLGGAQLDASSAGG